MGWFVHLTGDPHNLATIANAPEFLTELGWDISDHGDDFCVTSPEFEALNSDAQIRSRVSTILDSWNGAARLQFGYEPIRISHTRLVHAQRRQQISKVYTFRVLPAKLAEGHGICVDWMKLARNDPSMEKVLHLLALGALDWVNLYRIFELIADDCKDQGTNIVAQGWASKIALGSFTHTANCPAAIGPDARHGASPSKPPAAPMSLDHDRELITRIAKSWLGAKLANP